MLKSVGLKEFSFLKTTLAFKKAKKYMQSATGQLQKLYNDEVKKINDIHIVLLGRPYTVLSPAMNNHIPEIIEKNGITTFFMDMLPYQPVEVSKAHELVKTLKWKFASRILYAAEATARTENGYPVLITSFKCTPDSFVIEYFKEILNHYKKPYLILQLDEHDSAVGYETRIEAAIRAFRNHRIRQKGKGALEQLPQHEIIPHPEEKDRSELNPVWHAHLQNLVRDAARILKTHAIDFTRFSNLLQHSDMPENDFPYAVLTDVNSLRGKTLLLPSWDLYVGPLLEAVLQNSGMDARLLVSTNESMQRSLSYNTGQCLPLNMIVQDAIDCIEENRLNPSDTVLWIIKSKLSCNLSMFPYYMKKLLNDYGKGLEKTSVFMGDVMFNDFSLPTAINAYLAYMFGGYIRKIGCHIRPYERNRGSTDRVIREAITMLRQAFRQGLPKEEVLEKIILAFTSIDTDRKERPKVAIFGDLYVRDNDMMNQHLIHTIEENGGEVITTPFSEYIKIIVDPHTERSLKEGRYQDYAKIWFLKSLIPLVEDKYKKYFQPFSGKPVADPSCETDNWLNQFGLNILQRGESFENILKIHRLIQENPDLDLFIQTNPSYCCPSLVTEAMASRIEELTGVTVVTIEYDGTAGIKNEDIIPYLKYRKKKNNC
jgi:predicted nucleotide-binding protein (sugar kinase/HSP70/actin superfamily)